MSSEPLSVMDFILQELDRVGVNYYVHRENIQMPCPFGCELDRRDFKQKLNLHFTGQFFQCWVCKSSGNYNKLATIWGMARIPLSVQGSVASLEADLATIEKRSRRESFQVPPGLAEYPDDWRGIPQRFLKTFKSQLFFDQKLSSYRILWPVTFNGRPQGYVAGYLDNGPKPKPPYLNHLRSQACLFGIDTALVRSSEVIVLVEGPFDCIRFQYEGIPAVAILGTSNWNHHKAVMLQQRAGRRTKRVVIAYDGDEAGDLCRAATYPDLKKFFGKNIDFLDLPDGQDPGNCDQETVDRCLELCWQEKGLDTSEASRPDV